MKKLLILNTGGTFNKIYNPLNGELEVLKNDEAVKRIIKNFYNLKIKTINLIHKDSLEFTNLDRQKLLKAVKNSKYKNIIIIHGTDTIDKSSHVIKKAKIKKRVVLTGAMIPYFIDKSESISNICLATGFLNAKPKNGVYISMHGVVLRSHLLIKNKTLGKFLRVKK